MNGVLMLTVMIDEREGREFMGSNVPNNFIQTKLTPVEEGK